MKFLAVFGYHSQEIVCISIHTQFLNTNIFSTGEGNGFKKDFGLLYVCEQILV